MTDPQTGTFLLRFILKALGAGHPIRLGIGISCGIFAKMVVDALSASFPSVASLTKIAEYQAVWFVCVSTPAVFIPIILRGRSAPEPVVHTVNTIQVILDRAGMSKANEVIFWRALLEKYVAAAKPDLSQSPGIQEISEETAKQVTAPRDPEPS